MESFHSASVKMKDGFVFYLSRVSGFAFASVLMCVVWI